MKKLLLLSGVLTLLSTTGCIFPEGDRGGHDHARFDGPRPVVVAAPEVIVRPPEVIVR
jgi:hypothetical protein